MTENEWNSLVPGSIIRGQGKRSALRQVLKVHFPHKRASTHPGKVYAITVPMVGQSWRTRRNPPATTTIYGRDAMKLFKLVKNPMAEKIKRNIELEYTVVTQKDAERLLKMFKDNLILPSVVVIKIRQL